MSFASFPLDSLGLPPAHLAACTKAGLLTAADVLLPSPADLARKFRPSGATLATDIALAVSRAIAPAAVRLGVESTAGGDEGDRHEPERLNGEGQGSGGIFVSTGDAGLDHLLGGGARVGAITEIAGESAAGKSHLTLSLAIAAQLGSTPGGTMVLTSERVLVTARLIEIAQALCAREADTPPIPEILDNIHTSRVADVDALDHALAFVVPPMLEARGATSKLLPHIGDRGPAPQRPIRGSKPIRLLILDSLTALLRGETGNSSSGLTQRSRHLCIIADRLKALAVGYDLAIVVVNQVSDVFGPGAIPAHITASGSLPSSQSSAGNAPLPPMLYGTQARHFSGQSPGIAKEAALGIVWANAVNTRLMLARTGRRRVVLDDDLAGRKRQRSEHSEPPASFANSQAPTLVRRAHLVFSPFAQPAMLDYIITQEGVRSLPSTYRPLDLGPAIRRRDMRLRAAAEGEDSDGDGLAGNLGSAVAAEDLDLEVPPEFWDLDADEEEPEVGAMEPEAVGVVD